MVVTQKISAGFTMLVKPAAYDHRYSNSDHQYGLSGVATILLLVFRLRTDRLTIHGQTVRAPADLPLAIFFDQLQGRFEFPGLAQAKQ